MTENKDMAAVCGCGSVTFNLRKDNKIECAKCQTVIMAEWSYIDAEKTRGEINE